MGDIVWLETGRGERERCDWMSEGRAVRGERARGERARGETEGR